MFKSVGALILSVAMVLLGGDAFRQALNELRDTEPGSLLFGALQLVIGSSAVAASVGVWKRTRWASWAIGIWGTAAMVLLVSQPWFEPMTSDAQQGIWFGAAVVGGVAAGMAWCARRLARSEPLEDPKMPPRAMTP
ncbi:MAG: hypothetical protein IPP90_06485 [Gemmatimonadaceae bacterium]|nr:hypothetical protein [Gemmatimonadaceae bacterium]